MDGKLGTSLVLTQQLKLTPNVIFSLELLQLPLFQLENILRNEIEENPLIEPLDFVYESSPVYYEPSEDEESSPLPSPVSVRQQLINQVNLEFDGVEREIATYMVDNLDRKGLLTLPLEEIARSFKVSVELVESVRKKLKEFEPVGCGSLTLGELLESQLKEVGAPEKFIKAARSFESVKSKEEFLEKSGLNKEELEEFLSYLKRVDLLPFEDGFGVVRIKPDIRVWLEGDEVKVEVLTPKSFEFRVNSYYLKYAEREELRRYLNEKYQRALYLKRAIESRVETLSKLSKAIFERQREFLRDGKTLRPLTISQVALQVSLHESTVSRAVKDKFVETPFGVYPLKSFFKKGISGTSVEEVKGLIKELIENEDKRKPLSDSKIASLLGERGIKIARRTVAKYREEMGIPGAYRRKVK